jgi:hypothetical protein
VYGRLHYRADDGSIRTDEYDSFRVMWQLGSPSVVQYRRPTPSPTGVGLPRLVSDPVGFCRAKPTGSEGKLPPVPEGYDEKFSNLNLPWQTSHYLLDNGEWHWYPRCPTCGA